MLDALIYIADISKKLLTLVIYVGMVCTADGVPGNSNVWYQQAQIRLLMNEGMGN